jgi:hypothetical protein
MEKEIEQILKTLWSIKDNDEFYFKSYGQSLIQELIKTVKKEVN